MMALLGLTPTIDLSQIVGVSGAPALPPVGTPGNPARSDMSTLGPVGTPGNPARNSQPPNGPNMGPEPGSAPSDTTSVLPGGSGSCTGLGALAPSCWLQGFEVYGFLLLLVGVGLYGLFAPSVNVTVARGIKTAGAAAAA